MHERSDTCLFCEIAAGREPSVVVHEDDACLAFMDVHPLGEGHVLVIPKRHARQLAELDASVRAHVFDVANRVVRAQRIAGFGVEGTNWLLNDGRAANQHIPHVHLHLIPRRRRGEARFFARLLLHIPGIFGSRRALGTLHAQADRIRRALSELASSSNG